MLYATLIMMLFLDLPLIRSQYTHLHGVLTPQKDTLIVRDTVRNTEVARLPMRKEWMGGILCPGAMVAETNDGRVHLSVFGGQTLTFNDTVNAIKVLTPDRYLIAGIRHGGWTLVDDKGRVLRETRFSDVRPLYRFRGLFTALAGWEEDGEELRELWNADGIKAYSGVFHDLIQDDLMYCRRGGLLITLDTNGVELHRKTLYVVGEPSRENGFTGRWMWSRSRSFDPFMTMRGQDRAPEPPWTVPFDSSKVDIPIEGRLTIRIDSVTPLLFANKIKASTVVLKNVSPAPVRLSALGRKVPIRYQVENDEGNWVSVSRDNILFCGNSGGFHDLASGDSVLIPIPQFIGPTPTRFRVVIPYYDTEGRNAEVVSEPWEGTFNFEESEVWFHNGAYGSLEQIVGYVFSVGDPCNDPWLTTPLNVLPESRATSDKESFRTPAIATDSNGNYVPINDRVTISMDTTQNILYQSKFKGRTITLSNRSIGLVYIKDIIYEVKVDGSTWQRLDQPPNVTIMYIDRFKANAEAGVIPGEMPSRRRYIYHLGAYDAHTAVIPEFAGSTPARFRVRVEYRDMSSNNGEAVSAEWTGSINQEFDYKMSRSR